MKIFEVLVFIIIVTYIKSFELRKDLIKDFLKSKGLSEVNLLVCWPVNNIIDIIRNLYHDGIKARRCSERIGNCFLGDDFNVGFVFDAGCADYMDLLNEASKLHKFTGNQFWLILNNKSINESYWNTIILGADSEIIYLNENQPNYKSLIMENKNASLVLWEIYNTGFENNGVLIINDYGSWSRDRGLVKHSNLSKITQRSDLKGLVVRSSAIIVNKIKYQTLMTYLMTDKGDRDIITKAHMFVTLFIGKMFNMRFTYRRLTRWGEWNPKISHFDGQTGQLQTAEIDVGGSNQYLKSQRLTYVNYIGKSNSIRSIIVFKQPTSVSDSTSAFLKPLAWSVWYMTTGLTVMFIVLLMVTYLVEHHLFFDEEPFQKNKIWFSFLMIVAMLCQQGNGEKSIVFSVRIIMFSCVMFSFLLFQFYSASIVSFLLSEPPRLIKTPQDLVQSDLGFIIHNILYHKVLFETTKIKVARQLYEKKCDNGTKKNIYVSMEEGMELVFRGGYAMYGDSNDIYTYLSHNYPTQMCLLDQVFIVPQDFVYLCSRKGFPLNNMITVGLRRLQERSLMVKEYSRWTVKRPECGSQGAQTIPVSLPETRAAFQLLLWGILLSVAILLLEILFEKRGTRAFSFVL